jgi:hypothetical protein
MGAQMLPSCYSVQEGPCVEWIHSGDAGTASGNTMHCSNMNHNVSCHSRMTLSHKTARSEQAAKLWWVMNA